MSAKLVQIYPGLAVRPESVMGIELISSIPKIDLDKVIKVSYSIRIGFNLPEGVRHIDFTTPPETTKEQVENKITELVELINSKLD